MAVPRALKRGVPRRYEGMGTCRMGCVSVSAVLGRAERSITTLKVPGSTLCELTVCSSAVEKERERAWWADGEGGGGESRKAGREGLVAWSVFTSVGSGSRANLGRVGVPASKTVFSQSSLVGRGVESRVALSGGVWGKTGSGGGRGRWWAGRTEGLAMVSS